MECYPSSAFVKGHRVPCSLVYAVRKDTISVPKELAQRYRQSRLRLSSMLIEGLKELVVSPFSQWTFLQTGE